MASTIIQDGIVYEYESGIDPDYLWVVGCTSNVGNNITIPSRLSGWASFPIKIVTLCDQDTFYNREFNFCKNIENLTIEGNDNIVGEGALAGCQNLTTLTLENPIFNTNISSNTQEYGFGHIFDTGTYLNYPGNNSTKYYEVSQFFVNHISVDNDKLGSAKNYIPKSLQTVHIINNPTTLIFNYFRNCSYIQTISLENITEVKESFFENCSSLSSLTLNNTYTSIGTKAFYGCSSLASFTINSNITTVPNSCFEGCLALTSINLTPNITSLGNKVFYGCTSLNTITLNDNLLSIGQECFRYCTDLQTLNYEGTIADWCNITFYDQYSNPIYYTQGIKINNTLVEDIEIPYTVSKINNYAFYNYTNMNSLILGYNNETSKGIESIGILAFYGCEELTELNIPISVNSIKDNAFISCVNITDLTIPGYIADLGEDIFPSNIPVISLTFSYYTNNIDQSISQLFKDNCNEVYMPDTVVSISENAFKDYTIYNFITYSNNDITNTTQGISKNIIDIGSYAFQDCINLQYVNLSKGLYQINDYTFSGCENLSTIEIPEDLRIIGSYAFKDCISLREVNINSGITTIKNNAFEGCTRLSKIELPDSLREIEDKAFYGCMDLSVIKLDRGITYIGNSVFSGTTYYNNTSNWFEDTLYVGNYLIRANSSFNKENIKSNTKLIACNAFDSCTNLITLYLPFGLFYINDNVFINCTNLEGLYIPNTVLSIGYNILNNTSIYTTWNQGSDDFLDINGYIIKARSILSTTAPIISQRNGIACGAFKNCSNLITLYIEKDNNFTNIDKEVFSGCNSLTTIWISDNIKTINETAFINCNNITTIRLYSGSEILDNVLLLNRSTLTDLYLPLTINTIKEGTFLGISVDNIIYSGNINRWCGINFESISSSPFNSTNYLYINGVKTNANRVQGNLQIYDIQSIGNYSFCNYRHMNNLYIGENVENIGDYSFYHSNIDQLYLLDNVKYIGSNAFGKCLEIIRINPSIPSGHSEAILEYIGKGAFAECFNMNNLTMQDRIENIKSTTHYGYKGFNKQRDKLYTINNTSYAFINGVCHKTFEDDLIICEKGLHFCIFVSDLFNYYYGKINEDICIYRIDSNKNNLSNIIQDKNDTKMVNDEIYFKDVDYDDDENPTGLLSSQQILNRIKYEFTLKPD